MPRHVQQSPCCRHERLALCGNNAHVTAMVIADSYCAQVAQGTDKGAKTSMLQINMDDLGNVCADSIGTPTLVKKSSGRPNAIAMARRSCFDSFWQAFIKANVSSLKPERVSSRGHILSMPLNCTCKDSFMSGTPLDGLTCANMKSARLKLLPICHDRLPCLCHQ